MSTEANQDERPTYGNLYAFLLSELKDNPLELCDGTHRLVHEFAEGTGVYYGELQQYLEDHGGGCDCEVLFNCPEKIDPETVIGEEPDLVSQE
jgi:hypothetical protein